jgi:hypothetical protein
MDEIKRDQRAFKVLTNQIERGPDFELYTQYRETVRQMYIAAILKFWERRGLGASTGWHTSTPGIIGLIPPAGGGEERG